MKGAISTS